MLNEKLYLIFCDENDLGDLLFNHHIHEANIKSQIETRTLIQELLNKYNDEKFIELGFDKNSKDLIKQFISCKYEKNWKEFIKKFLMGVLKLLEREISKSSRLKIPSKFPKNLQYEMTKLPIYHKNSIIKINEVQKGVFEINLLNLEYSPDYNPNQLNYYGKWESFRDTQLVFILNFNKNLLKWEYINVHKRFQGMRIGTKSALMIENFASKLGFSRFSVEFPNRQFWINKMGYDIPDRYKFGSGMYEYTLEAYKEI
ncbi:MAG: hypothetical protein ACTSQ5_12175 [Promethearchaeota archaeon]